MVNAVAPIISTAVGIAATYGAGVVNVAAGVGLAAVARPSIQRAAKELAMYKTLKNQIHPIKQEPEATAEEHGAILLDDIAVKEEPPKPKVEDSVDKIKSVTDECFRSAVISKQFNQVQGTYRVAQANQASLYAQAALGVSQVAVATSSIGNATLAVTNVAIGFSFLSAIFYLGASIYGFASAYKQLSENKQRQKDVLKAIESIQAITGKTYDKSISVDPDSDMIVQSEVDVDTAMVEQLNKTLVSLQTENALLVQQCVAQAINAFAALLSIVAISLFTAGTNGTAPLIYYTFLIASIVLPFIAMGYSQCSMNETKYMKALQEQLDKFRLAWNAVEIDKNTITQPILELTCTMLNLEITDPTARKKIRELFQTFINDIEKLTPEKQIEKLKELFKYLTKLQDELMQQDLDSRLRMTGMKRSDIEEDLESRLRITEPKDLD